MLFVNHVSMAGQKAVSTLMGENLIDLKYIRGTYVQHYVGTTDHPGTENPKRLST